MVGNSIPLGVRLRNIKILNRNYERVCIKPEADTYPVFSKK